MTAAQPAPSARATAALDARGHWVLLRGLAREAGHWGAFPDRLRAAFPRDRVSTPDLPGCGVRAGERAPISIAALAETVRRELAATPGEPLWLVGLSLGGMVALEWARQAPGEVAGVALVNSSAAGLSPWWRRLRPRALVGLLHAAATGNPTARESRIFALTSARPEQRDAVVTAWARLAEQRPPTANNAGRMLLAAARYRVARPAPAPNALVVVGAEDRLVHPTCSGRLADYLGAKLAVHPTAGHELPTDDPDWLLAQLSDWRSMANRCAIGDEFDGSVPIP